MKSKLFRQHPSARIALLAATAVLFSTPAVFAASDYGSGSSSGTSRDSSGSTSGSPSSGSSSSSNSGTMRGSSDTSDQSSTSATDSGSLGRTDRRFIMRAAESGEEEVALSQLAAQRATNPEVRNYAAMIVADHEKANAELASLAQRKGVAIPMAGMPSSSSSGTGMSSGSSSSSTAPSGSTGSGSMSSSSGSSTGTGSGSYGSSGATGSANSRSGGRMSREAGATGNSDIDRKLADLEKKQGADFDRAYIDSMVDGHKDAIKLFEDASKNASDAEVKSFAATHLPTLQQHDEKAQQLKRTVRDAS